MAQHGTGFSLRQRRDAYIDDLAAELYVLPPDDPSRNILKQYLHGLLYNNSDAKWPLDLRNKKE